MPDEVVYSVIKEGKTKIRAWREYLSLTQAAVAKRLQVLQSAYAQLENREGLKKSTLEKIANQFGINLTQLDF